MQNHLPCGPGEDIPSVSSRPGLIGSEAWFKTKGFAPEIGADDLQVWQRAGVYGGRVEVSAGPLQLGEIWQADEPIWRVVHIAHTGYRLNDVGGHTLPEAMEIALRAVEWTKESMASSEARDREEAPWRHPIDRVAIARRLVSLDFYPVPGAWEGYLDWRKDIPDAGYHYISVGGDYHHAAREAWACGTYTANGERLFSTHGLALEACIALLLPEQAQQPEASDCAHAGHGGVA